MTDAVLAARGGPRTVRIGTAGGATRPSTGYTFSAMQRQAADIARMARAEAQGRLQLQRLVDQLPTAVAAVDAAGRVASMNPAMQRLLGLSAAEVLGRPAAMAAPALGLERGLQSGAAEHDSEERPTS